MLTLDRRIRLTPEAIKEVNLCDRFSDDDLKKIGGAVFDGYRRDKHSRAKWEQRNEAGMNLALQVSEGKSFPWPSAANVAFPLVTIGAMQFHARAYPAIISGTDIVKCRVIGADPGGEESQRCYRISEHMSWQVLEEDQAWEDQHDRGLLNLAIVGTNFMKTRYDASQGVNVSELVLARDLVVDYWAKSIESAARKSQLLSLHRNAIYEKAKAGVYRNVLDEPWFRQPPPNSTQDSGQPKRDSRDGIMQPEADETTPFPAIEQHVLMDLDGDGYAEPYIITLEESSQSVLRIVTAFDRKEDMDRTQSGEIITIRPTQYYTKYSFIPSPDGGFYDVGFGVLLGPLNESTNSIINQLIDAGTISNTAGGFLGRGAKIRGGTQSFAPWEWKRLDATVEDISKAIFPLPVREPSNVLFQLLGLMIDYTNRVSGANDMMVGENPGQNTPAETSRAMIEQGSKIYTAIFKRVWRSMKEEFKKRYVLNALYLPDRQIFGSAEQTALREDYLGNPNSIAPAADPNITSEGQKLLQAQAVKASAATTPGYDIGAAERFYLRSLKVSDIDTIYPGPDKVPQGKDVKLAIQEMKTELAMAQLESDQNKFALGLMEEQRMNNALIAKIEGELQMDIATEHGNEADRQINATNTMLGLLKQRDAELSLKIKAALDMAKLVVDTREKEADREVERQKLKVVK